MKSDWSIPRTFLAYSFFKVVFNFVFGVKRSYQLIFMMVAIWSNFYSLDPSWNRTYDYFIRQLL